MRRVALVLVVLILAGFSGFLIITHPRPLPADAMAGLTGTAARGKLVFWAGGCSSCHAATSAEGDGKLSLGGGRPFPSPFGTFIAPNISPDPDYGIGTWSVLDLANAMTRGVSPQGQHYFPVFPYASFTHLRLQDVADLYAYLMTLPKVAAPSQPHQVSFPFNIRRGLGGWKFLYFKTDWVVSGDLTPAQDRGRYLVEGLSHCGECHTPRTAFGGMDRSRWLAGGPIPASKGHFPNITPGKLHWSEKDIVEYLASGFTPDFDSAGGHMALVVENMAKLPASDREAIAAYLKLVPAVQ